jgi:3-oxoacid CoA-transferase B subunit
MSEGKRLNRDQIAKRVAAELQDGWLVNLGLGIPTLAVNYIPEDRDVLFHSENGIIGMGPRPDDADVDVDLMSAGKGPVTLVSGAAFVHHADSFVVARGGRLNAAILGAYQVADNGDFANWRLPGKHVGGIGGAMDIAVGAQRVFITMSQTDKKGTPKLVEKLTYPLTTRACVTKVFTDMAVISVTPNGFVLNEVAPGFTPDDIVAKTAAKLHVSDTVETIAA